MGVCLLLGFLLSIASAKKIDYRTTYVCEGGELHINCEQGYHINLVRANYGRFSISICNENGSLDWRVNCKSQRSYYIIHERCNHMSSCKVSATSDTFDDACPGTYKYLEVQYQCKLESTTATSLSTLTNLITTPIFTTSTTRPPIIIPLTRSTRPPATTTVKSFSFEETDKLPSTAPSPIIFSSSTTKAKLTPTASLIFNKDKFCHPVHARNLFWDWTKAGTDVVQKCPGGTIGDARWRCDTDPVRWVPSNPDLSQCSSLWADNLKTRVGSGDSVVNIAAELSVMTHRKLLYGGDIRQASEILHRLITKMREKIKDLADDKQQHQLLKELLESTSDITSNLFDLSSLWGELKPHERRNIASTLLETLELCGWLLASSHKLPFSFQRNLMNLFISVQVMDTWSISHILFPSNEDIDGKWNHIDTLSLPMESLLSSETNGLVKVVLVSYKSAKDFLGNSASKDHGILHNSSSIINSRIISAYTGSYSGVKFHDPVAISFKLLQEENVTNPQCVYWDLNTRLWSHDGCWLKKSNQSHAVCECNHLTNFALLMDLDVSSPITENGTLWKKLLLISCGISVLFLLITAIILHFFRNTTTDHTLIHKHICICLILVEIIYMVSMDQIDFPCAILAGFLHFLLQAVFVWLFLSALQLYLLLKEPVNHSRSHYYIVVGYIVPLLIVIISVFVDSTGYGASAYCFLRFDNSYIFSFVGPATACILGTFIFLTLTSLKTVWFSDKNQDAIKLNIIRSRHYESWFVLSSICCCWIFLLLYMKKRANILAYIFGVLNFLQGLIIFTIFGFYDSEMQQAYRKWKDKSLQPKNSNNRYPLSSANSNNLEIPYLPPSTTVSSLSTVTTPEMEYPISGFHHPDLYHTTRSPIYDNRERLVT